MKRFLHNRGRILIMVTTLCACSTALMSLSCTAMPSGSTGMPLPPQTGEELFTTAQATSFGSTISCSSCHGLDGSGGLAGDVRGSSAEAIAGVTQGTTAHPADTRGRTDVRYPDLTAEQIGRIAAFLAN